MQLAALALAAIISAGAAVDAPPLAFDGYNHPEITADNCKVKDPGHVTCFLPPKTMGRYLITVMGASTATGPNAVQAIAIGGPGWTCGQVSSRKGDWTSGSRTFVAQCEVTVLSDTPFEIDAAFGGPDATLDPAGPKMSIRNIPWNGMIQAGGLQGGVAQKSPPGGGGGAGDSGGADNGGGGSSAGASPADK